jgi:cytochrome c5
MKNFGFRTVCAVLLGIICLIAMVVSSEAYAPGVTTRLPEPASGQSKPALSGKQVYVKSCELCHGPGLMKAPRLGNKQEWEGPIAKGLPTLYTNAIKGYNSHPPKGTHRGSDDEVKAGTRFMVDSSK